MSIHSETPQPSPSRITPFTGHPLVVGITLDEPELVPLTAATWAAALDDGLLYFAYVDPSRYVIEENPDGTVLHADIDPDVADDTEWQGRQAAIEAALATTLAPTGVAWEFRYLAGEAPRALTHLARAVDAAAIVVGTREQTLFGRAREAVLGSVAHQLAVHQHRPVLVVPRAVVDWDVKR